MGDPQQLPATVLSARARELALERSLFERLQAAGCPCRMLSVQYRMQPAIREFPSRYFYGGRLEDGASVLRAPQPAFYKHPLLKPYVVFDVVSGREQRHRGGGSLRNQVLLSHASTALHYCCVIGRACWYRSQCCRCECSNAKGILATAKTCM